MVEEIANVDNEFANLDPLTSFLYRQQLHLNSATADYRLPLTPGFFGCSDFYPPPPPPTSQLLPLFLASFAPEGTNRAINRKDSRKDSSPTTTATEEISSSDEDSVTETNMVSTRTKGKSKKVDNTKDKADNDDHLKKIAELQEQLKKAQQRASKPAVQKIKLTGRVTKAQREKLQNKELTKMVRNLTTKTLWRTTKFIKNDKDLEKKTIKVMEETNMMEFSLEGLEIGSERYKEVEIARDNFVELYSEDVKSEINEKRNYTQVRFFGCYYLLSFGC